MRSLYSRICSLSDSMRRQQRLQCALQFRTQALRFLRIHVAHVASAQPLAVALGQSACRVHQRRPRSHQSGSRPDHRQIRLRFRAAMLHRTQQLRINPRQPRQRLRIQPIVFLPALPDQAARCAHAPRSLRAPVRSAVDSPTASASRFPARCDSAACRRTPLASPSESCSRLSVPAQSRPVSSSTQYQLDRSPRSKPIVSFG